MKTQQELIAAVTAYMERHGLQAKKMYVTSEDSYPIRCSLETTDFTTIEAAITIGSTGKPRTTFRIDGKIASIRK